MMNLKYTWLSWFYDFISTIVGEFNKLETIIPNNLT